MNRPVYVAAAISFLIATAIALVNMRRQVPVRLGPAPVAGSRQTVDAEKKAAAEDPVPCGPPPAPSIVAAPEKKAEPDCGKVAPQGADPFAKKDAPPASDPFAK